MFILLAVPGVSMLVRKTRQRAAWAENWLILITFLSTYMMQRAQTGKPTPVDILPPAR